MSGCSEERRMWRPALLLLHTLCLIKHTSNALADFLQLRAWRPAGAHQWRARARPRGGGGGRR